MSDQREFPIARTTSTGSGNNSNYRNNPYVYLSPVPPSSAAANRPNPLDTISDALNQCSRQVVVQLDQVSRISPSTNRMNPKEKYIQVVTVDGYEFVFMGFMSYDKALKTLNEALQQYGNHSRPNASVQP